MKTQKFARIFGLVLTFLGMAIAATLISQHLRFSFANPAARLQILWEQDLQLLRAAKKLPPGFDDVKEIQIIPGSDNAKVWLKEIQVPIKVRNEGQHKMEVLVLTWEEGEVKGAIVQHNLVDLKTNNMIWELGRTYVLEGDTDLEKLNPIEPETVKPATSAPAPSKSEVSDQGSSSHPSPKK